MANKPLKYLPASDCKSLALIWLQQQDLSGKSAIEIADLYCSALSQIWEKYAPPQESSKGGKVVHPGIESDPW